MRKRRRLAIAVSLVALVATFFLPPVYWRVVGWSKGEAFYDGRPTSWWEQEIQALYCQGPVTSSWYRVSSLAWYEFILPERLRTNTVQIFPPLTKGDPKELDVVLELLRSEDPKVRLLAIVELGCLPNADESVLRAVERACEDSNAEVRTEAKLAVSSIKWRLQLNSDLPE